MPPSAARTPLLWLLEISLGGPLMAITSSIKTAMFIASGSGMPSSLAQVP
jgi:hypothetical protein